MVQHLCGIVPIVVGSFITFSRDKIVEQHIRTSFESWIIVFPAEITGGIRVLQQSSSMRTISVEVTVERSSFMLDRI